MSRTAGGHNRLDVALWIVLGALAALLLVTLALPTTRRIWVFTLYFWKTVWFWLLGRLGLGRRKLSNPALLRRLFEDLGPTFIKFGQIIASSAGLFPKTWVEEFQKCLDRVRPFSFDEVRQILHEELGPERAARLVELDPKPLASASIAQVHTARLASGEAVVVKVQRPGIQGRVDADMRILKFLAKILATTGYKDADLANPVGIVEDFEATLNEELDFRKEARNLDEFNEIMGELGHADIHAPRPNWEYTTRRVLVMQRFFGIRVDDVERIRAKKVDAEEKLIKGLRAWFQSVLFYGFFHGDVHAGNLMLLDDGHLGFLDFGIVGRFDDRQRAMVTDYVVAFASGDYKALANVIVDMGGVDRTSIDLPAFVRDLEEAYSPLLKKSFGEINYAEMLPQIQRVSSRHRMRMPKEFVLITKQMLYFDRYAKLLAPNLNVFTDPRLVSSLIEDVTKARALRA